MNIPVGITRVIARGGLFLTKYSPQILLGAGVVGTVASGVMLVKATLKVEPVMDDIQDHLALANDRFEQGEFDESELRKDKLAIYTRGTLKLGKLYGPAVTVGALSLACFLGAYGITNKRLVGVTAAYNVLEKSYSNYRNRVAEEIGEEREAKIRDGWRETEEVDFETGEKFKKANKDPNSYSPYARFFDDASTEWNRTPEYSLMTIKSVQNHLNDMLHVKGHVWLNEAYRRLGLPETQAGQVMGWVIGHGDPYVDFGLFDFESESARRFVNGEVDAILLDFNVTTVLDKI